jgi:hypothetical protein
MLAFSIKRYLPTRLGIITLECGEVGYLYVGQKAYNSGILLTQSVLDKGFEYVEQHMKPANVEDRPSVKEFYDKLPNPLKPLALLLYNTVKEYTTFEEQVGVLDVILQSVFPTAYFHTPKNQRITFEFGRSIESEYRYDWETFFNSCIDYDTLIHPKDNAEKHPIFVVSATMANSVPAPVCTPVVSPVIQTPVSSHEHVPIYVEPTFPQETTVQEDITDIDNTAEQTESDAIPDVEVPEEISDTDSEDFLEQLLKED